MIKHNQNGAAGLAVSFVLCLIFLLGALGFGAWAFSSRQNFKNNVDTKIAAAQEVTKQQVSDAKDKEAAEKAKSPLRTYNGPEAFGSFRLSFPKTWSAYVDDSGNGSAKVDGYFYPNVIPALSANTTFFALRVQLVDQKYSQVLTSFAGQQAGTPAITITPYALPKLPSVVGAKITGVVTNLKPQTIVAFPLRTQTVELWTEGDQYINDFNTYILPNFTFSP